MKDVRKFSNLPMEVMNVVNEILHTYAQETSQLIKDMVHVETTFINLQHPDFADVIANVESSDNQSVAGQQQAINKEREQKSKDQGFVSNFFGGQDALNRSKAQQ